jgi:DNA-binding NarL/FixJ family response regulator
VYRTKDLRALLLGVARLLPVRFGLHELDWILREVLTDFLPGVLEPGERPSRSTVKPEEIVQVRETVDSVLHGLSQRDRDVLAAKLAGVADADMAKVLNVSRPTAANAKHSVVQLLKSELDGLSEPAQEAVVDELARQLAGCWPPRKRGD